MESGCTAVTRIIIVSAKANPNKARKDPSCDDQIQAVAVVLRCPILGKELRPITRARSRTGVRINPVTQEAGRMALKLKRLADQVMVITGATSGIGLATAKRAAQRGARVVLCSRNEQELQETVTAIQEAGGTAVAVVADVSIPEDMERLASTAIEAFGSLDT